MERKPYCSVQQKTILLDFMGSEPELVTGKFSNTFTFQDAQRKWQEITLTLNAIPGSNKDWKHWRKTWHDIRNKTKGKQAAIIRDSTATGGGPSTAQVLTGIDLQVLEFVHPTSVRGLDEVPESMIENPDDDTIEELAVPTSQRRVQVAAPEYLHVSEVVGPPCLPRNKASNLKAMCDIGKKHMEILDKFQQDTLKMKEMKLNEVCNTHSTFCTLLREMLDTQSRSTVALESALNMAQDVINDNRTASRELIASNLRIATALESIANFISSSD